MHPSRPAARSRRRRARRRTGRRAGRCGGAVPGAVPGPAAGAVPGPAAALYRAPRRRAVSRQGLALRRSRELSALAASVAYGGRGVAKPTGTGPARRSYGVPHPGGRPAYPCRSATPFGPTGLREAAMTRRRAVRLVLVSVLAAGALVPLRYAPAQASVLPSGFQEQVVF